MPISIKHRNRGDTLIEVLFAVSVFSLVAVGAFSVMNQGTATAQRALEITLVRQEIDAQAETLRFLNASYISSSTQGSEWTVIRNSIPLGKTSATTFGTGENCPNTTPSGSFVLNTKTAKFDPASNKYQKASTFAQVRYINGQIDIADGIWIEAIKSDMSVDPNEKNAGYIDFHIRACWESPGQQTPITLGTIVRLYEPI